MHAALGGTGKAVLGGARGLRNSLGGGKTPWERLDEQAAASPDQVLGPPQEGFAPVPTESGGLQVPQVKRRLAVPVIGVLPRAGCRRSPRVTWWRPGLIRSPIPSTLAPRREAHAENADAPRRRRRRTVRSGHRSPRPIGSPRRPVRRQMCRRSAIPAQVRHPAAGMVSRLWLSTPITPSPVSRCPRNQLRTWGRLRHRRTPGRRRLASIPSPPPAAVTRANSGEQAQEIF